MRIGVPKEIKNHEYRVGLTPGSVQEVIAHGHDVLIETTAGDAIGFTDADYIAAGATISPSADDVFENAELIIKVKEPQAVERKKLRPGQLLFTYLHLAPDRAQTDDLIKSGATCIAYETVTSKHGGLPLLAPMSEVAGRLSIQAGAQALEKSRGGRGVLLGGVPGVEAGYVVIIGGGFVGRHAAQMAVGLGAHVTILDKSLPVLRQLERQFNGRIQTLYSKQQTLENEIQKADLVVGSVLIPGAATPKLITREMLGLMQPGSAVVDVAIDQGGCFETARPTTHDDPIYIEEGIVHYCVANMPGAVPRTSTVALNNATLPFIINLANLGLEESMKRDVHFRNGLNVHAGKLTNLQVGEALGYDAVSPESIFS